jgi:acetone carboxylase gamma subunit
MPKHKNNMKDKHQALVASNSSWTGTQTREMTALPHEKDSFYCYFSRITDKLNFIQTALIQLPNLFMGSAVTLLTT